MTTLTIEGNTTDVPTLGYTQAATAYASFTVAVNTRRFDKSRGEWVTREPVFHRVVTFGDLAENVANSLQKGTAVIVVGDLVDDSWTDGEGRKQPRTQIEARNIAPSLRNATAQVTKNPRRQPAAAAAESSRPGRHPSASGALPPPAPPGLTTRAGPAHLPLHPSTRRESCASWTGDTEPAAQG